MSTSLVSSETAPYLMTTLVSTTLAAISTATTKAPGNAALSSTSSLGDSSLSSHDQSNQALVSNYRDPFYSSTFPVCYALAATTVTAYMLLIMLFMTPRSFLDGGVVYLGRRSGFTHSSSGGENIGGRPWLQKVAALTVAVSLTIATYDTFKIAELQYSYGVQNAASMKSEVMGSMELRVTRLVSNFFLWLAQAQTLIRLFPRHREKVIIKWVAFALITLDLIFSAINSFKHGESGTSGPNPAAGSFDHPIPALSYMFQLLLGVLYAAWVIYYSLMKKRYAFYHHLMRNMCVLAMISLISILIPVVFFILDISRPKFAGWGDYVRWVGAAAASVIVWEWVERIEALEREEKKGGILGREVLDGDDDVLEVSALEYPWDRKRGQRKDGKNNNNNNSNSSSNSSSSSSRSRSSRSRSSRSSNNNSGSGSGNGNGNGNGNGGKNNSRAGARGWAGGTGGAAQQRRNRSDDVASSNIWPVMSTLTGGRQRGHPRRATQDATAGQPSQRSMAGMAGSFRPSWPRRPAATLTPVSRTDSLSAASTVYAVRYQPCSETSTRSPDPFAPSWEPQPLACASAQAQPQQPHQHQLQLQQQQQQQQLPPSPRSPQQQILRRRTADSVLDDGNSTQMSQTRTDSASYVEHEHRTSTQHTTTSAGSPSSGTIDGEAHAHSPTPRRTRRWQGLTQTTSRRRSPGARQTETTTTDSAAAAAAAQDVQAGTDMRHESMIRRWDIRSRLEMFAATQAERVRERLRPTTDTDSLPVTYVPAPPRQGTGVRDPGEDDGEPPRCPSAFDSGSDSDHARRPQRRRRQQQQQQQEQQQQQQQQEQQEQQHDMGMSTVMGIRVDHQRHQALPDQQPTLSSTLPPLWPGVRRHTLSYQDYDDDDDDDDEFCTDMSADESSLEESGRADSDDDRRPCGDWGD
ncbi:hypothetical protein E4U53_002432 [Claviceps sorghi]|nr:hypothetical protein E4U53_002432 [Claviceps sorghi]